MSLTLPCTWSNFDLNFRPGPRTDLSRFCDDRSAKTGRLKGAARTILKGNYVLTSLARFVLSSLPSF